MTLFLLTFKDKALERGELKGHPAFSPHTHAIEYVIRARDEETARYKAFVDAGDDIGEGDWWLDFTVSLCREVILALEHTEIITSTRGTVQ